MTVEWSNTKLGDLFDFKNGMNAEKAAYGDGIPFVNVMDVFGNDIISAEIIRGKIKANEKQINDYLVKYGDILFNRTSETFDEIAMSAVYMDDKEVVFGGFVIRARPKNNLLSPNFCVYFFQSFPVRKELIRRGQGAVRANIGQKDLATVPTILPPLPEQKKIAEILSTWDRAIEVVERLIENSQAQKKALMQQLLTAQKRLPGFDGEWEDVKLGEVSEMNSGGTPKSSVKKYYGGNIPWVSIADMTNHGKYIFDTKIKITEDGLQNSSARIYPVNTVLYAMYASIGECSLAAIELCSSQAILGIRPRSKLNYEFLYFFLCSLKNKIKLQGQQGTQANLNAGMVKKFRLKLPPLNEQTAIANILTDADREIELLAQQLAQLKSEKSALMQQLLTGKRRVKIDKEAVDV